MRSISKIIIVCLALILLLAYSGVASKISIDDKGNLVGDGYTLYYFSNEGPYMTSTCYGSCSETWKPFIGGDIDIIGGILKRDDFGTIIREDGFEQTSYKKWPLYRYFNDTAGEAKGNGTQGLWFVVKPGASPFI
jgi:predicted lipoprotein with Yx(FWY)xxD motif